MSQGVHCGVYLRAFLALGSVVPATAAAFWSRPEGARVEYRSRRLGRPASRESQKYAQIVDHLLEDARFEPPLRLLVDSLPRRQVVWPAGRVACSAMESRCEPPISAR